MRHVLGYVLYVVAIAMTVLVILAKWKIYQAPQVSDILMKDSTVTLLVALGLSFVSRWL